MNNVNLTPNEIIPIREDFTILELLTHTRKVTDNYEKAWGKWSQEEQWKKIEEEDFEFKTATSRENELEEFWDRFFATLTLLHQKGYWNDDILTSGIDCLNKINNRSLKVLYDSLQLQESKEI